MNGVPSPALFRVLLPARDLARSQRFYESLLAQRGRRVAPGRIYFDCGRVILGILDRSASGGAPTTLTEALYFAIGDLDAVFRRARKLKCLETGVLHEDPAQPLGRIKVRPWGERSFYAVDPAGNPLCFVDQRTKFTGTPRQVERLMRGNGRARRAHREPGRARTRSSRRGRPSSS